MAASSRVSAIAELPVEAKGPAAWWQAYRLRQKRQLLLARALRKRRELQPVCDRTAALRPQTILAAMVVRNEALRLPYFLAHHRRLGVGHFLIIDNDSSDATVSLLQDQPDVSLWRSTSSYRSARFGLDWLNALLMRHGHGHWVLTLDADELLLYPYSDSRDLHALTGWLEAQGQSVMPAMMLDLYPEGPLGQGIYHPGQDPLELMPWFDAGNYGLQRQARLGNLWIQGGPRARVFFADTPRQAPTLNKLPLVKWHWRNAWLNSTHSLLPPQLNHIYDTEGGEMISGVLLHTKFLPEIIDKSREELERRQHFADPRRYGSYYDGILQAPVLHTAASQRFQSWRQLEALGLMSRGGWI